MTVDQFRLSPLAGHLQTLLDSPLEVVEEPFARHLQLRIDPDGPLADEVAQLLGCALPVVNRATRSGPRTVIWLGPDEWLIITDESDDGEADLDQLVRPAGGAVVDVSGQRTTLRLSGPYARPVLAKGCSVDLHRSVTPVNFAVQTTIAHAGVIMIAEDSAGDDLASRILVRTSFARHLADWLIDAALEYTVPPL